VQDVSKSVVQRCTNANTVRKHREKVKGGRCIFGADLGDQNKTASEEEV